MKIVQQTIVSLRLAVVHAPAGSSSGANPFEFRSGFQLPTEGVESRGGSGVRVASCCPPRTHETRSAERDPSDEGIYNTFVSVARAQAFVNGSRRRKRLTRGAPAYASSAIGAPQYAQREVTISFVSELCHIPPETPAKHGDLRGRADAHLCCEKVLMGTVVVGFEMRQCA